LFGITRGREHREGPVVRRAAILEGQVTNLRRLDRVLNEGVMGFLALVALATLRGDDQVIVAGATETPNRMKRPVKPGAS